MAKILVTGSCGYIGSHIVKAAYDAGHNVHGLDIEHSENNIYKYITKFYRNDIRKREEVLWINEHYDVVIHCAALISVAESVEKPNSYYETNVQGTINLLQNVKCDHFVFASTGGAFDPISPYAKSKIIAEEAVKQIANDYTIFRFFNVAGNNREFRQICDPSHLMHIAALTAAGQRDSMTIFGDDYNTPDGTCIRDYVHVVDLSEAIVSCINTPSNTPYECIGSGAGYSNLEVVNTMKRVTGIDFEIKFGKRRSGDPAKLVVDNLSKYVSINRTLGDMCRSAYSMEKK